ncbi:reverse transcriptase family protein [Glutamicibacter ardleyensis]|uniref:reverse transcriptase family protein n=1 Tax=Glutamicibacter ardleyensis TaxID=225894 RepID=UPI003F9BD1A2
MNQPPHLYANEIQRLGGSLKLLQKIREVDANCAKSQVQSVYTLAHLAKICGMQYSELQNILENTNEHYSKIQIEKREYDKRRLTGPRYRYLNAPDRDLKYIQRRILEHCISQRNVGFDSYAYESGKNTLGAVRRHVGASIIFKFDLADFFDSINHIQIFNVFIRLGYPKLLSYQLSLLTTYGHDTVRREGRGDGERLYERRKIGKLPQGSPTSGALSNLVLNKFDRYFSQYAMRFGAVYTRYADDFQLSFRENLSPSRQKRVIGDVFRLCELSGFQINREKTRVLKNKNSFNLLGLSLKGDSVTVNANYRKKILAFIYTAEKYSPAGYAIHLSEMNKKANKPNCEVDEYDILARIYGHYCYIMSVDENFSRAIADRVRKLVSPLFSMDI